jgi:ATP-binding cassette subfamily F protein 3
VDLEDNSALRLKFPPAPHSGVLPVDIEHLTKAYGDHIVLNNIDLQIHRGEKVAFVGKNGEGKSTLVKCIMQEIEHSGTMKLGHGVKIGYFAQNQASLLDENLTVFDTIDYVAVGDIRTKIRDILGAFMFGGEASDKKVKVLSGGERSRLAMIRLLLEPVNLLILDEPTNHLDMRSKDVLKEAIKAFDGTVIVVSHDREFLDGLVTKVYEFGNQRVKEHLGGIYDFLQSKNMTHLSELELTQQTKKKEEKVDSQNKISYEARKEQARQLRKQERLVEEAEKAVSELEQQLAQIEAQLAQPQAPDSTLLSDYQSKQHLLEQKMYEWELLSEQLEELKGNME